jgi:hypothetical protein
VRLSEEETAHKKFQEQSLVENLMHGGTHDDIINGISFMFLSSYLSFMY